MKISREACAMKPTILFLEQQSWRGGAQHVLQGVLDTLQEDFLPVVAFPDEGVFRRRLTEKGIETISYPLGLYRPGNKSPLEMFWFILRTLVCVVKLTHIIINRNIRLLYINGPRCLPAGVLAARLTRRPIIFHLHITLTRRIDIFLTARLARWTTKILACSKAAAASLLTACPELGSKTSVVYNCVDSTWTETIPASPRPHMPFTIGLVARITSGKGHHILIEALSRMEAQHREKCRIIFVGAPAPGCSEDDAYMEGVKARSRELGVNERILWAGHHTDVNPFYQMMDVLAVPSVCFIEGLSLVTLEAMQRGIPVIAPNSGGTPEIVEHEFNGLLVSPGDVAALAHALERMLTETDLYQRMCAAARTSIDGRFTREAFVTAITSLTRGICPSPRTSRILENEMEIGG
jgi:glycosyltransferase involved in cell wall biosynthesis